VIIPADVDASVVYSIVLGGVVRPTGVMSAYADDDVSIC